MDKSSDFRIAVLPGDGIGVEVMDACLEVLRALEKHVGGFRLAMEHFAAGAEHYRNTGVDLPDATFRAVERADAVLFGAIGLPDVRKADGTEINPQLDFRMGLELYAGVRPIRALPGLPATLADPRARQIDLVVIREQTEGLFTDIRLDRPVSDESVIDRMVITRAGTERVADFAFRLARKRREKGRPGLVTCVDKANVLPAMAFFRKVFDERASHFPDVKTERAYIDATALNLVRQPWTFDVMVMENMFGDIVSDLTAALVGGMGLAPSGDIGDERALFQPAHGSAPDIAGTGKANPTAMFLSAAMMLEWLGERHGIGGCLTGARVLEAAVDRSYATGQIKPFEFGGSDGTQEITRAVLESLSASISVGAG